MVYSNNKVNMQWRGDKSFALLHCIKAWPIDDVCSSMFPPAIVCRNNVKVSGTYDRSVDNASAELTYNDSSGATVFTSLLIKKNSCNFNDFGFFGDQQCNSLVDSRNYTTAAATGTTTATAITIHQSSPSPSPSSSSCHFVIFATRSLTVNAYFLWIKIEAWFESFHFHINFRHDCWRIYLSALNFLLQIW